ncbi:hypothetical protein CEXT_381851 [Caerostris extrusa]|uniref:Uncharacterized protein n=1 Tax=Caerostris extrusa TaxID=172846 RepID=A0AAV4WDJ3_CAEEX|nr:hypothetical protein CEXT_381851 [Caerostris extrusa]
MKWSHGNSKNGEPAEEGQESSKWIDASMGLFLMKQHRDIRKTESKGTVEPQKLKFRCALNSRKAIHFREANECIDPSKGNLLMKWSHGNSEKWGTSRSYRAAKHRGARILKWIDASMGLILMKQHRDNSGKRNLKEL